jgi:two-component sensor histidine kinase
MSDLPNSTFPDTPSLAPAIDVLPLLAWLCGPTCEAERFSSKWHDYTGLSPEQSAGHGWLNAVHADDAERVRDALEGCGTGYDSVEVPARLLRHADSGWRWHDIRIQPLGSLGSTSSLLSVAVDVHERRVEEQHARLLYQAAELLSSTLDPDEIYGHLRDLIGGSMVCDSLTVSIFDPESQLIRCSYAWLEGETIEASSLPVIPLAPEGKGMQSEVIRSGEALLVNDFEAAARNSVTVYHVGKGGKVDADSSPNVQRTQAAILVPIKLDGQVLGVTRVLSNYQKGIYSEDHVQLLEALMSQVAAATRNAELYQRARAELEERRKAEHQLREKQQEVDELNARLLRAMQETHHRVKNNLQFICALVDMQVESGAPELPINEFQRVGEHVRSLAAIHDLLTVVAKDDIEVETLSVQDAIARLLPILGRVTQGRLIAPRIDDIQLPVRQSAALTVLLNELITNAAKHGQGTIQLSCCMDEDRALIEVLDEGPGFPPDFDIHREGRTGLELVETLGRWDLRGETRYENREEGGARVAVYFPIGALVLQG